MMNSTVLIVDDNPKNLQVLAALLYENNYDVEVASSGKDAINLMGKSSFDTILLDIMMPEMDGFETCKRIKSKDEYKDIPIIFLTARHDIESIEEGFKVGGVDYITKPFNESELLVRVKTHIELKKSREKLVDVNIWLNSEVERKTAELKKAYDHVKRVNEQLCELDDAKNYFLNSISHELRTPLNGIVGSVSLLKTFKHTENVNEILMLLDSSIKNLEKYSYAALQISHLKLKGVSQLSLKQINLIPIIHSTYKNYLPKAQKQNIALTFKTNRSDLFINGDYNLIQKTVSALMDCAFTYTNKGSVEIETLVENNEVQVILRDTGSAYEGNIVDHFFKSINNQNYQFNRNNSIELYLAQIIVSLHNGCIEFSNTSDGCGTITIIKFPQFKNSRIKAIESCFSDQ